jgi:hypothetical protein
MTLEKHNMLYAVQFALHEYDETGAVCRRTMEMLGARAILLRYEIEGEMADALAKERAKRKADEMPVDIQFTPDEGVDVAFTPEKKEIKRKNGRKNCAQCGTRLTGQQRKFCSKKCSRNHWQANNRDKTREYYLRYEKKLKRKQALKVVK